MLPARRVIMQGAARAALKQQQRGALQKIIPTTSSAATSSINNNKTQCRYFSQQKSLFDDATTTTTKTKTTTQKTETTQDDFTPQSIEDHKWADFFNQDLDLVILKRLQEHYKSQREQAVLPPPPSNMPRDSDGNEVLYFFDDLVQYLFALESPRRKQFMKWLLTTKNRESLARKIHFAFVRTKLAAANIKVEVPRELKREQVYVDRLIRAGEDESELLAAFGRKRLAESMGLSMNPEDARLIQKYTSNDPLDEIPAYFDEWSDLNFEDKHRRTNKQHSILNAKKSTPKQTSAFPSSWNELALELTGEMPQFDHALNNSVSTDSQEFLDKAFRAEKALYSGFNFKEDEFQKYNMFLDEVEDGTMTSERIEGLPSGGAIGAEDEEALALEYPEESYERHGARGTFPEGYYGDKFDPFEIKMRNPKSKAVLSYHALNSVRSLLPGTFFDDAHGYEEFVLKKKRTTVNKSRGRIESYNSYVLIVSPSGFIGAGFGEAQSSLSAGKQARKNAILNLRAVPRSAFPLIRQEIRAKFMKSEVCFFPSTHRNPVARPLFMHILRTLGIEYVAVKCYGSNNIINVIPAFFRCLDKLKTLEKEAMERGMLPTHLYTRTEDMLERVRHNRGIYGWH